MIIEQVFPDVIQEKDNMRSCLTVAALNNGLSNNEVEEILTLIPPNLLSAGCFLDKMTKLWRYEFDLPANLNKTNNKLFGTHMWLPVENLLKVLVCAKKRLPEIKFKDYLLKLDNPEKHRDHLAEMMLIFRLDEQIPIEFEISGLGLGNTTIDWHIGPIGKRHILVDAKNRMGDLYSMMDQETQQNPPKHDPFLLFRSIENKFKNSDPNNWLQGAWINTQIKQEHNALINAFDKLDKQKVHFVILGDELDDALILAKRPEDETFLRKVFQIKHTQRFTYDGDINSVHC